jgi:superfamily I DNA/RNA helicase
MIESINQALMGQIDYDDQIYMPTLWPNATFPNYPLVGLDESQDFSALNHAMLRKLIRKRVIAVGDENQSIYGFRGAHEDSMDLLRKTFSMHRLDLSVSFRARAPRMQWPEWAQDGLVESWKEWKVEDLPADIVMLCRNNAPLFNMAIRLIKNGRFPELVGNDIGKRLIKVLENLGPEALTCEEAFVLVDEWEAAKKAKSRSPDSIADQAECLRVFLEHGKTLGESVAYAKHILSVSGNIKLMTIHKSKGLEWPNVAIIDRHLIRVDKHTQERNLLYVAQTRAKSHLVYLETDKMLGE